MCTFANIEQGVLDASTLLPFRHLIETHQLARAILETPACTI